MNNRKDLVDNWLTLFTSHYKMMRMLNPSEKIDDVFIENFFDRVIDQYGESLLLSDEEKAEVIRKIKASYSVFQEEGCALIGDYDHDFDWYKKLKETEGYDEYYWQRYKNHLIDKHFSEDVIDRLENTTLESIMSYIGNPAEEAAYSIRGLVVGDVQSGKTSNYIGLLTKAADAGYKVIFLLTGTIESLRKQTQIRVEEGFIGYDSVNAVDVGVGRGSRTPKAFTSREKDFTGTKDQNTTYRIGDNPTEPMIFVIKKNVSVLKKLFASLKNINTDQYHTQINAPMLMIDDEADNASINTNKADEDPTKINNYIRRILALFSRNSYVGFTATPFANVFISYDTDHEMLADDLFPKDFIYALESPSNYCGARKYFFEKNDNVKFISDTNDELFPMSHKKEWSGDRLFDSFYKAINEFLLINAIRDKRDMFAASHRSMLINMSRFTRVQQEISRIVEDYLAEVKRAIKQTYRCKKTDYLNNPLIKSLYDLYEEEFAETDYVGRKYTWDEIFEILHQSVKDIIVAVVNSSRSSMKLDYEKHKKEGMRVIAVGGLALSRGLTLEGLCVSYFYRNTATFDVLMQMGRWFGYRDEYADLCRIWMTKSSFEYYREISESIDNLKKDIRMMGAQSKRPQDYGIRVRNNSSELGITAANKMRSTKRKTVRKSFYGNVFETPYLYRRIDYISENSRNSILFLGGLSAAQRDYDIRHPYFKDIEKDKVVDFLEKLHVHEANENFDVQQLVRFIRDEKGYRFFDILVMGGQSVKEINLEPDIHDRCIDRQYDIVNKLSAADDKLIRINKVRAHLWGPRDTSYGLPEEKIKEIQQMYNAVSAQDFMLEGRNPLLIIYFINLTNKDESDDDKHTSENTVNENISEEKSLKKDLRNSNQDFLTGYAIGFPKKTGAVNRANTYVVNTTCNYYDKKHEEDQEMYGEDV